MPHQTRRSFLQQSAALSMAAWAAPTLVRAAERTSIASDNADALRLGVAFRDITPEPGVMMWGYSEGGLRLAEGVRDPLFAKALVFQAGEATVGWVVLDMGRTPAPDMCASIRSRAKDAGIGHVILSATHTHSGPFLELPGFPHLQGIEDGIVAALTEAHAALQPVRMGVGRTRIDIAHNRRVIRDGKCYMRWRNAEREPTAPLDQEAGVVRFDREDGSPLAALVNYACHPVIFGPDNRRYSADWPGEMCRQIKEVTGADAVFVQGGCGDINPYLDKMSLAEGAEEAVQGEGRKAAEAVLAVWADTATTAPAAPSLAYSEQRVPVGLRWDTADPKQVEILRGVYGPAYDLYMKGVSQDLAVPLAVLTLNNALALAFFPGEMFVQFQLDLKTRSPLANTLCCGYANEFHAYFPTVRDAACGGYGGSLATYVGLGAGDKLVTQAAIAIGEMTGMIHPLRGPEDLEIADLT